MSGVAKRSRAAREPAGADKAEGGARKREWITSTEAAELLGITRSHLHKIREKNGGPPFYAFPAIEPKAGGRRSVRYDRQEVLDWIESHRVETSA